MANEQTDVADERLYRFQEICQLTIRGREKEAYRKMVQQALFIKGGGEEVRLFRVFLNAMNQAHYHILLYTFEASFHQLCYRHGILFHEVENWNEFLRVGKQIINNYAAAANSIHNRYKGAINTVINYIRENIDRPLTLREIADQVYLSRSYLSSIFKETMGENIKDFIYRERMRMAQNLLLSTDAGVQEISCRCGYQSFAYFSASFRRYCHMSPTSFRQRAVVK